MSAKEEIISMLNDVDTDTLNMVHYFIDLIQKGHNPCYIIPNSVIERLSDEQRNEVEEYYNSKFGRG